MSLKLLDLLNGSNSLLTRIPALSVGDLEILGAWLSQLRRRVRENVKPASFISSRLISEDGTWTVTVDGQSVAVAEGHPLALHSLVDFGQPVQPPGGTSRLAVRQWQERHQRTPEDALKEGLLAKWKRDPTSDLRGRAAAQTIVRQLRELKPLPDWPNQSYAVQLSSEGRAQFEAWLRQWRNHQTQPLRLCSEPTCRTAGGRIFVAKRNERDCPYCRRGASKSTRRRRRLWARSANS